LTWAARYARVTGQRLRVLHVFSYRAAGGVVWTPGGFPGRPAGGSDELRDVVEDVTSDKMLEILNRDVLTGANSLAESR